MDLPISKLVKKLVLKVKEEIFSSSSSYHGYVVDDLYSLVSPSPYDTAWLAMIPNPQVPDQPLFRGCLDWVLRNQKQGGFWASETTNMMSSIESLTATLACIVALTTWNVGHTAIQKGTYAGTNFTDGQIVVTNFSFNCWRTENVRSTLNVNFASR